MAYFNHAFQKTFLGTKSALTNANQSTPASGFIYQNAGTYSTVNLIDGTANGANLGIGSYGFFNPKTWTGVDSTNVQSCCPLVLAASALYQKDQIAGRFTSGGGNGCQTGVSGGFHGGYQESNKSKVINPKYVSRVYRVDPCVPNQNVVHIGATPFNGTTGAGGGVFTPGTATYGPISTTVVGVTFTGGTGTGAIADVTIDALGVITSIVFTDPGSGYTAGDVLTPLVGSGTPALTISPGTATSIAITLANSANCCKEFLCDQSYSLRIDIKGSPTLRALTRNSYMETATWTGCCPPNCVTCIGTPVDPTTVYIAWANQLINSQLINPFIQIIVYDQNGNPVGGANDQTAWCAYDGSCTPVIPCTGTLCVPGTPVKGAGMTIIGAYVGTVFGDCTFYPSDFFEKEPVHIYASMVDYTGDVCEFEGICITETCCPRQGNGFGETVLQELILSERYQQNDFYTGMDLRIREITQGYDVTSAVNRAAFYTRYYIQHNVPRYNNPTGTFDNDQYLLQIITNGVDANLEAFFNAWIFNAQCQSPCNELDVYSCGPCCPVPLVTPFASIAAGAYSFTIPVVGTATATFSGAGAIGTSGLSLNPATGEISGTPVLVGVYHVTTTATNSFGMVVGCFDILVTVTA